MYETINLRSKRNKHYINIFYFIYETCASSNLGAYELYSKYEIENHC